MRASTYIYNTPGEIKKLLGAVEGIAKGLSNFQRSLIEPSGLIIKSNGYFTNLFGSLSKVFLHLSLQK